MVVEVNKHRDKDLDSESESVMVGLKHQQSQSVSALQNNSDLTTSKHPARLGSGLLLDRFDWCAVVMCVHCLTD